jgi:hypothetical protein
MECKNKSDNDNNNNKGKWNHIKTTQKIPEQHTRKAQNQGTTENSHISHCTHTSKVLIYTYKTFDMGNYIISTLCKGVVEHQKIIPYCKSDGKYAK